MNKLLCDEKRFQRQEHLQCYKAGRLKIVLRNAANAVGNLKDTALSNFFKRIAFRKGRMAAISATARKLAAIMWNMIVNTFPINQQWTTNFLTKNEKEKCRK